MGLAAFLLIAAVLAFVVYFALIAEEKPVQTETAEVIGYGMGAGYSGNKPLLKVMTARGDERSISVEPGVLESCQVGDEVLLHRQGVNLTVAARMCE